VSSAAAVLILLAVNALVMLLYGADKLKAQRGMWRIPEKVLIGAAVFGVFGAAAGMLVFHHKTRKLKFRIAIPAIMISEIILIAVFA
jgi:uncharacterized membrane protein YsdA (DUF1294 family)